MKAFGRRGGEHDPRVVASFSDPNRRSGGAVRVYFDDTSGAWDDIYERGDVFSVIHQDRLARAKRWIEALCLPVGASVLEVGCGAGRLTGWLRDQAYRVRATDTSEQMLALTARQLRGNGSTTSASSLKADAHVLPFASGVFDLVVALGVIPWLHDPSTALREISRVTRGGGFVLFSADNIARLSIALDPLRRPGLGPLRSRAKAWLAPWRARGGDDGSDVEAGMHSHSQVDAMAGDAGLVVLEGVDIGFGPFTFLRREVLPQELGVRVNRVLQRASDRRVAVISTRGSQYLLLTRKP